MSFYTQFILLFGCPGPCKCNIICKNPKRQGMHAYNSCGGFKIWIPFVSPHPYILHMVPSGMEHPATGSWIVWTLSAGRAGLDIINAHYSDATNRDLCLNKTGNSCFFFRSTNFESLRRAKLDSLGPHITWAILTSCLLGLSGDPSRRSETPSHTRYSLRSGTLKEHKKNNNVELKNISSFNWQWVESKTKQRTYQEEKHCLSVSTHSSRTREPPHQCTDLGITQKKNVTLWMKPSYLESFRFIMWLAPTAL